MAEYYGFQLRIDSTLNWYASNPRLALGEPGIDINLLRFKVGNGIDRWNELPYMNDDIYKSFSKEQQTVWDKIQDILNLISQNKLTLEQGLADLRQEFKATDKDLKTRMSNAETRQEKYEAGLTQRQTQYENNLTGEFEQTKSEVTAGLDEFNETRDALNTRMDVIAGSATNDTEILDARIDAKGETHPNLGHNLRNVHSEVISLVEAQTKDAENFARKAQELKTADDAEREAREAAITQETQTRENEISRHDEELSEIRDAAQKTSDEINDLRERTDDNANGILSTVLYLHDETEKRREISSELGAEKAIRAQEVSALSTKLTAEQEARAIADEKLQVSITKETEAREKSFEELDKSERETFEKLTDEITERAEQAAKIEEALTQESSERKEADAELRDGLTHERTLQQETGEFLRGEIDALAGAVINGQITFLQLTDELKAKIIEEAETRKLRDDELTKEISTLGENLTSEINAREKADRENSKNLSDEISQRKQTDEEIRAELQNSEAIQQDTTDFLKDEINTLADAVLAGQINFSQIADRLKTQCEKLTDETAARIAKDDELTRETERLSEVDEALQHFTNAAHEYAIARGDFQQEQINETAGVSLENTLKIYELQKAQKSEEQIREKETSELGEKLDDTSNTLNRHDGEISRLQEGVNDTAAATLANTVTLSEEITRRKNLEEVVSKIKSPVDWSDAESLQIPEPRCAVVNFSGLKAMPTTKTAEIPAYLEFWDMQGNYFKKNILCSAQGSSSLGYVKKNVKFDLLNDDGGEFDLKIGGWVVQDGFHLKAYYTDFFRGVGVTSYKLWHEIMKSLPYKDELINISGMTPTANGAGNVSDLSLQLDTGAMCHPDGFPCIVYLNGEFYGVYSWQIKKQRKNYHMEKSTVEQIHLDGTLSTGNFWNGIINWSAFEIRNPNKLYTMDGKKYDGDAPRELIDETSAKYDAGDKNHVRSAKVKKYIQNFVKNFNELKTLYATYKATDPDRVREKYEEIFSVKNQRDYLIFSDVVKNSDGFAKNWQWTTYDGVKWYVNAYDLDMSFGGHWQGIQIIAPLTGHITTSTALPTGYIALLYKTELEARYQELRDAGIIDALHILKKLEDWTARIGTKNYEAEYERWPNSPCIKNYRDSLYRVRMWLDVEISNMDKVYNYVPKEIRDQVKMLLEVDSRIEKKDAAQTAQREKEISEQAELRQGNYTGLQDQINTLSELILKMILEEREQSQNRESEKLHELERLQENLSRLQEQINDNATTSLKIMLNDYENEQRLQARLKVIEEALTGGGEINDMLREIFSSGNNAQTEPTSSGDEEVDDMLDDVFNP